MTEPSRVMLVIYLINRPSTRVLDPRQKKTQIKRRQGAYLLWNRDQVSVVHAFIQTLQIREYTPQIIAAIGCFIFEQDVKYL